MLEAYGGGVGTKVENEAAFEAALRAAWADTSHTHLIQAKLVEGDASETLLKLAARMGKTV